MGIKTKRRKNGLTLCFPEKIKTVARLPGLGNFSEKQLELSLLFLENYFDTEFSSATTFLSLKNCLSSGFRWATTFLFLDNNLDPNFSIFGKTTLASDSVRQLPFCFEKLF